MRNAVDKLGIFFKKLLYTQKIAGWFLGFGIYCVSWRRAATSHANSPMPFERLGFVFLVGQS